MHCNVGQHKHVVHISIKHSVKSENHLLFLLFRELCKGWTFLMLCGWIGVMNLWSKATSDSHYQRETQIFERQERFSKYDLVNNLIVAFTTILDKGYRVTLAAWQAGKQMVMQPDFAKSDKKLSGNQILTSVSVATDRSGNKRKVNIKKKWLCQAWAPTKRFSRASR